MITHDALLRSPASWAQILQPIPRLEFEMRVAQLGVPLDAIEVLTPSGGYKTLCSLTWTKYCDSYLPREGMSPTWYIYDLRVMK